MEDALYIFSSAHYSLYKQNLLDCLSVPTDYVLQFRYAKKYVQQEMWELVETPDKTKPNLIGYKGIVIFVDQSRIGDTDNNERVQILGMYPLRVVEIIKTEIDGEVLHLFMKVKNYATYENIPTDVGQDYSLRISESLNSVCPPNKYLSFEKKHDLVFSPAKTDDDLVKPWTSIVDILSDVDLFKHTVFYQIKHIREIDGSMRRPSHNPKLSQIFSLNPGYELRGGKNYSLDLTFYKKKGTENSIDGAKLIPELDDAFFAFDSGPIDVRFRYDKKQITLITKPLFQEAYTQLRIRLDKENENGMIQAGTRDKYVDTSEPKFSIRIVPSISTQVYVWIYIIATIVIGLVTSKVLPEQTWLNVLAVIANAVNAMIVMLLYGKIR